MDGNQPDGRQVQTVRRELVAFTPARSEKYAAGLIRGLREQAERAGYAVTIFENEFDQDEQNEQLREYLAQGEQPGMWIWWPVQADKALAALRTLAETDIPVLQLNQLPDSEAEKLVTAFVGPDDRLRARNAAQMMIEARDALAKQGKTFASDGGNTIVVTYPTSYGSYALSMSAFKEALQGSGIQIIGEANAGFGAENGYTKTKQLLEEMAYQQIDFVYGMDDALLQGAIQAMEEAGFELGKDVIAVGTVGNGDRQLLATGKQYGTTLQAPLLEGQLAVQVADEIMRNGAVKQFLNFTPNPAVRHDEFSGFTLEGFDGVTYTMDELASWEVGAQVGVEGEEQPLLRMRNISRSFGVIQALKGVNFEIRAGEIMALVGENGAGKSTLVKIISGFDEHFTGNVEMNGEPIVLGSPVRAEALGIAIAQQELSLIPTMTVAENVFLADPSEQSWASISNMSKRAKPHLELVGLGELDPTTRTDRLSVGEQHLVEIARLIARDAQILILDEPTAALGEAESRRVLERVQALAKAGKSIIYVSHRLDEVFAIADRVTVLRDGRSQEAVSIESLTVDSLIERMLGRPLENMFPRRDGRGDRGEVVLEVENLWADGLVEPISLEVRAGEILGLAGQLGSGSSYLLAAMAGARRNRGGKLQIGGKRFLPKSPGEAIKNHIAYCSSDRKKDGLFLELPIYQNMTAPALGRVSIWGWLQRKKEVLLAKDLARDFQVDVSRIKDDSRVLSGGNQQKVAVGKWMSIQPKVILVDEPTRGVDVGARAEIYQRLRDLADSGVAVVFASTDIQEVTFLPDRIVTFYRGQMIESLDAEGIDSNRLLKDITHPYDDSEEVGV
jgi:ABC-type sugar transport system ATPase subunit/ABC-type sugar transport system substrate-binding protein